MIPCCFKDFGQIVLKLKIDKYKIWLGVPGCDRQFLAGKCQTLDNSPE